MAGGGVRFTFGGGTPGLRRLFRQTTVRGLTKAAEHVLSVSREQVPLDEGTLMRSGETQVDERALTAGVGYNTPYAEVQHERLDLQHPNGRKAKYLEDPLNSEAGKVAQIIAAEMRGLLGRR